MQKRQEIRERIKRGLNVGEKKRKRFVYISTSFKFKVGKKLILKKIISIIFHIYHLHIK